MVISKSSFWGNNRVLITGATGFLGYNLCETLVTLEAEVYGLSPSANVTNLPKGVKPVPVDLCQFDKVQMTVADIRPDFIFHLASLVTARPDPELILPTLNSNLLGTVYMLISLLNTGCKRMILVGSCEEPASNEPNCIPTSPYAAAKMAASSYGRMFHLLYKLPVVIVRPFLVYGPHQNKTKLIPYTILSLLKGEKPQLSSGTRICDAIYVGDIVQGMLRVAIAPASLNGEVLDLGSGQTFTIHQIIETIHDLMGSDIQPYFGALSDRPAEKALVADTAKTQQLLDWKANWSLEDGLRKTIEWYCQEYKEGRI